MGAGAGRRPPEPFGLTFQCGGGLGWGIGNRNKEEAQPMGNVYEIYALRYATMSPRTGFGRSSTTNGIPASAAACIASAIV